MLPVARHAPGEHAAHAPAPTALLNVPAGHAVGAVEPAGQKEPATHVAVHALVGRPVTFPNVPAGQSKGATERAGQYEPGGQAPLQALVCSPAVAPKKPAGHAFVVPTACPATQ